MIEAVAHTHEGDPLEFYSTAATVIPVILLAGLYQAHVRTKVFVHGLQSIGLVLFVLFALFGEVAALHVLSVRYASATARRATGAGLIVDGSLLVMAVMIDALEHSLDEFTEFRGAHPRRWLATSLSAFVIVIAAAWLLVAAALGRL